MLCVFECVKKTGFGTFVLNKLTIKHFLSLNNGYYITYLDLTMSGLYIRGDY